MTVVPNPDLSIGEGRHYIVLSYGDWHQIWPYGIWTRSIGRTIYEYYKQRPENNRLVQVDQEILATGKPSAKRTKEWLANTDVWKFNGVPTAVQPWTEKVAALANDVLRPLSERGDAAIGDEVLLSFVFGDEQIVHLLQEKGLYAIISEDPKYVDEFMRIVDVSGRKPCLPPESLLGSNLFSSYSYGYDVRLPANRI